MSETPTEVLKKDTDFAYLAGLVDGEGYIGIIRGWPYYRPLIAIESTSGEIMEWLKKFPEGRIYYRKSQNPNWKDCHTWRCHSSSKIKAILAAISPYVVLKKKQVELMHEYLQLRIPRENEAKRRKTRLRPLMEKINEVYYLKFRALINKGKSFKEPKFNLGILKIIGKGMERGKLGITFKEIMEVLANGGRTPTQSAIRYTLRRYKWQEIVDYVLFREIDPTTNKPKRGPLTRLFFLTDEGKKKLAEMEALKARGVPAEARKVQVAGEGLPPRGEMIL